MMSAMKYTGQHKPCLHYSIILIHAYALPEITDSLTIHNKYHKGYYKGKHIVYTTILESGVNKFKKFVLLFSKFSNSF